MGKRSESEIEEYRQSAHRLVMAVLTADDLHMDHKKEFIRLALFKVTEVRGKYTTGFISKDAFAIREKDPTCKNLRHEHVIPRLMVFRELLKLQRGGHEGIEHKAEKMLRLCDACILTREEHSSLSKNDFGWFRYLNASEPITIWRDNGAAVQRDELRTLAEIQLAKWKALEFDSSPATGSKSFT